MNAHSGQKRPNKFKEILQTKAYLGNYLKKKYISEHYQKLDFNYIIGLFSILYVLFPKVSKIKTTISIWILSHWWIRHVHMCVESNTFGGIACGAQEAIMRPSQIKG